MPRPARPGPLRSTAGSISRAFPLWLSGALLGGASSASSARAQAMELSWTAPAQCSERSAFERAFTAALGAPLAELAAPGTRVRVRFAEGAPWRVTVEVGLEGATRTRTLSVERSCHELDDGIIVVVALLVEEVAARASVAAVPASTPIALPPSEAPTSLPLGREPGELAADPPATLRGALALGVQSRFESLPGLVGGPLLAMEVRVADVVALGVGAGYFPPATTRRDGGVAAEVSAVGVAASGCVLGAPAGVLELGGCGAVAAFLVTASGSGLAAARRSDGLEVDAMLEARGSVQLAGPLWLRLTVGLGVALVRSRIYYEAMGTEESLHLTSLAFPAGGLLLELRLGE